MSITAATVTKGQRIGFILLGSSPSDDRIIKGVVLAKESINEGQGIALQVRQNGRTAWHEMPAGTPVA